MPARDTNCNYLVSSFFTLCAKDYMHQAVVSSLCGEFNIVSGDARAGMLKEIENSLLR
jgi:hypothetical protein